MIKSKNNKPNLIITYTQRSTFVKRDIELLATDFNVIEFHFNTKHKWKLPLVFLKQFIFYSKKLPITDIYLSESSGYLSFIPTLFKRMFNIPSVIIAIGTDCIKIPEINYGAHQKKVLGWFTRWSFKNCSKILPVHEKLIEYNYTYESIKQKKQGIKAFINNLKTPIQTIENGFDTSKWSITNTKRTDISFLSITTATNLTGYYLKGIDLIVAMAKVFSQYHFTIVGKVTLPEKAPENITFLNHVPPEELNAIYNSHKYYLQLSMSEGFPNTLGEAMLCGCIPIVSDVGGNSDIIDNQGFVLTKKNIDNLCEIINNLSNHPFTMESVRNQIINTYPLQKRKDHLIEEIKKLL